MAVFKSLVVLLVEQDHKVDKKHKMCDVSCI